MEGDFNFYMDPARDKQNNMNSRDNNPIYKPEIIALQVRLHLTDAWRVQNPNTFAWPKITKDNTKAKNIGIQNHQTTTLKDYPRYNTSINIRYTYSQQWSGSHNYNFRPKQATLKNLLNMHVETTNSKGPCKNLIEVSKTKLVAKGGGGGQMPKSYFLHLWTSLKHQLLKH